MQEKVCKFFKKRQDFPIGIPCENLLAKSQAVRLVGRWFVISYPDSPQNWAGIAEGGNILSAAAGFARIHSAGILFYDNQYQRNKYHGAELTGKSANENLYVLRFAEHKSIGFYAAWV